MNSLVKKIVPTKWQQVLRAWLMRRRLRHFPRRTVAHHYCGHPFKVSLQDSLAAGWYDHDWGSMPEIEFLRASRLQPGATVFDLGAHQGVVAMILARTVGEAGLVVAVEGTRHNAQVALENCQLNQVRNIRVRHAVGAEQAGQEMIFSETLNGAMGGNLLPVKVPSVSVDSLAVEYQPPDVVFVDVEGYECQVLAGARQTIRRGADFFVEVHAGVGLEKNGSVSQVLACFAASHYRLFWSQAEGAAFQPLTDETSLPATKFFLIALGGLRPFEPEGTEHAASGL